MKLKLIRFSDNGAKTLGMFLINDRLQCSVLEDTYREKKIKGQTRIPAGTYKIKYRLEGGHFQKYKQIFPELHTLGRGMLQLCDVPGFDYILIHCGNTEYDTDGCLLVGFLPENITSDSNIIHSRIAYAKVYSIISPALDKGDDIDITIIDADRM